MNLPKTFEPIAYTDEVEDAALAAGWTVHNLSPMESGPRGVVPARCAEWRQRNAAALSLRRHPRRRNFRPAGVAENDPAARFFRRLRCDNVSDSQSDWPRARLAEEPGRNRPQSRLPKL
jgi:hypothetical protein